ncbi:bifunctional hydroxymethylpyrimidine kinase/phosphomethylpyrimidine kinase [Acetobacter sp. TBRC 12305]|uniref:hydroxymethylpyrimidine kinase n=1 Tax=Acetobacter garciniae TaxID=2817435 RepID=A0A939KPS6_9PROT|nr:bifunctional hydroxymethylpyrimidine kinase/phosphomethylpyrimidine kinase [Acetobacter garciniae]MBO1324369.1 bifunctional hydroxymethylpyrimidine kinase/phosphomethylpyrimidine kinase [Acetobacter garciniae]MBX0344058.1 bifunctional hydroxymethylpyrimidine kinase/phosphomethylpyrimidine kinase [Acetobacter garciniae]
MSGPGLGKARILSIAGSDSGGGAGIQADIKTVTALGGYAMTAITALTAQNTLGVHAIMPVPPGFVREQIRCVLDDIGADAIKTGMLGGVAEIDAVAQELTRALHDSPGLPVVVDPVMVAKGGAALLQAEALETLRHVLLPLATVITPNLPEATQLTGLEITTVAQMRLAASTLRDMTGAAVLLKGGHLPGNDLVDILLDGDGLTEFASTRLAGRHTHGTGCTLASALATRLAQGVALARAVEQARDYVRTAIAQAPGLGQGAGPLWHAHGWGDEPDC